MGKAVIGCDICQDVCPWNRKSFVTQLTAFQPRRVEAQGENGKQKMENGATLFAPELEWLATLSQEEFSRIFRGSAIKRAKWRGLVRNACVALGNSRAARDSGSHMRITVLLERLATSPDEIIAEHAQWALDRLRVLRKSSD
jgi:epoxyqueuosine reductase